MKFIDNSQYKMFVKCPYMWYERYVNHLDKRWPESQRSDPLCVGALVHSGLENWYAKGRIEISPEVIGEMTPSPDALALATSLVHGYAKAYPQEFWELHKVEQPLTFPLRGEAASRGIVGLAKIDSWFYNPTQIPLETGVPGYTADITAGYWIKEYKTKSQGVDRANWILSWQTAMQASFQMLALDEELNRENRRTYGPSSNNYLVTAPIQGLLVSVLEKPRDYTPRRKCKGCGEMFELEAFFSTGDGHACPSCGHIQKLKPYEPKTEKIPGYFRLVTTRSVSMLEEDLERISYVAMMMDKLRTGEISPTTIANKDSCIDLRSRWAECTYFNSHTYQFPSHTDPQLVGIDPIGYVGLPTEEA